MAQMNPRELDVLDILWKSDAPLTSTDIVNNGHGLTQSTVIAVLRKLLKADLVEVAGVTHSGKVLSRTYRPTEASRDVLLQNFTESYASFSNVIPKSTICDAIMQTDDNPAQVKKEIEKLKAMLEDFEKGL